MRSLNKTGNEITLLALALFFVVFMSITAYYIYPDDWNPINDFEDQTKAVKDDFTEKLKSRANDTTVEESGNILNWIYDNTIGKISNAIGVVLDTAGAIFGMIYNTLSLIVNVALLNIPVINQLGLAQHLIRIPIYVIVIYAVIKAFPTT